MLDGTLVVDVHPSAVEFAFTVSNADTDPVELTFRSGKVADVAVYDGEAVVWRWSDGRMFTQALRTDTFDPGESFTHTATWEHPSSGSYTAEATLEATNADFSVRQSFTVED